MAPSWVQNGSKIGPKTVSEARSAPEPILDRFGVDFGLIVGRFLLEFGSILGRMFGQHWDVLLLDFG